MEQRYVGEILVRRGALPGEKLEEALATATDKGVSLMAVLVATRTVDEPILVKALADEIGMSFVPRIDPSTVPEDLVGSVPINFARQHRLLPIGRKNGGIEGRGREPARSLRARRSAGAPRRARRRRRRAVGGDRRRDQPRLRAQGRDRARPTRRTATTRKSSKTSST